MVAAQNLRPVRNRFSFSGVLRLSYMLILEVEEVHYRFFRTVYSVFFNEPGKVLGGTGKGSPRITLKNLTLLP